MNIQEIRKENLSDCGTYNTPILSFRYHRSGYFHDMKLMYDKFLC